MTLNMVMQFFLIIVSLKFCKLYGSAKSPQQQCGTPRSPLTSSYKPSTPSEKNVFSRIRQEEYKTTNSKYCVLIPSTKNKNK